MMQNPALQDKLCLKFLLVIVPGVFAHTLRDWSRSKQSGQYGRDTCVTTSTFLHCESNEWSSAGLWWECRFIPHHGWSTRTSTLSPPHPTHPAQSAFLRYQIEAPSRGSQLPHLTSCLSSAGWGSLAHCPFAQLSDLQKAFAQGVGHAWTNNSFYL